MIAIILEFILSAAPMDNEPPCEAPAAFMRFQDAAQALEPGAAAEAFGSGSPGRWTFDAAGLPAYEYTMDQQLDARALYDTTHGALRDHWHLLGNDRVKATAHNGGYVLLYDWSRGGKALARWRPVYCAD